MMFFLKRFLFAKEVLQKLIWIEKEEDSEDNDFGEKVEKKIKIEDINGVKNHNTYKNKKWKNRC